MDPPQLQQLAAESSFWAAYFGVTMDVPTAVRSLLTENSEGNPLLTVSIPCPGGFVESCFNAEYWSIELTLVVDADSQRHEMGWWDDARQHPNALRWEELSTLREYWARHHGALESSIWFLLLVPFVGTGQDERGALDHRRQLVVDQLRSRHIPPENAAQLAMAALHKPPDPDYQWRLDPELGWLFSGEYPCYSIRNREHTDGSCGRFPFREWHTAITSVAADHN